MLPKASWLPTPGCLSLGEWSHHVIIHIKTLFFCRVLLCILGMSSLSLLLLLSLSISVLYHVYPSMKYCLDLSSFLEEFFSRSHSSVFVSLHCSFKKFLSLVAILWNSSFSWAYLSLPPLLFASLLSSTICKASSECHLALNLELTDSDHELLIAKFMA